MLTEQVVTIGGSLVVSIVGMLVTNAIATGWKSSKLSQDLREVMSEHVRGLYGKIDDSTNDLRGKLDEHFRDDVVQFTSIRRETGEMGHALREKIRETELWNRDHFLQVKHFDTKIATLMLRMDYQDGVLDRIMKSGE